MYICLTCGKEYTKKDEMVKHYLACWKAKNPYHQSKPAPRSENITTVTGDDEAINFFNSFRGITNARDIGKNSFNN